MSKSKPYSSVPVKSVEPSVLASEHRGQACVLGIDVAKFELMAVLRWPDGTFGRPWRIANPGEVGLLVEKLGPLQLSCPVTVEMESSGTYGDAVRQALGDRSAAGHRKLPAAEFTSTSTRPNAATISATAAATCSG